MNTLKKAGLIKTQPRMLILDLLENSEKRHLSINEMYEALHLNKSPLTLGTIYRVLDQFVKSGLVTSHHFSSGNAVFELCGSEPHDHLVDIKTGKIIEFYDEVIVNRQHQIASEHGFKIHEHRLVMYGKLDLNQ